MRYAILSDVHANLEALTAVLDRARQERVDAVVTLGDLVGFNASPNECLDVLRHAGARSVAGNHDVVACGRAAPRGFSPRARHAIEWTAARLRADHRAYLDALPLVDVVDDVCGICHGSWRSPFERVRGPIEAAAVLHDFAAGHPGQRLCFFGHTHRAVAYHQAGGVLRTLGAGEVSLDEPGRYLVNPGSVGQPRDGDPRAAFAVFDAAAATVRFHRVRYDRRVAADRRAAAGLPRSEHRRRGLRRLVASAIGRWRPW